MSAQASPEVPLQAKKRQDGRYEVVRELKDRTEIVAVLYATPSERLARRFAASRELLDAVLIEHTLQLMGCSPEAARWLERLDVAVDWSAFQRGTLAILEWARGRRQAAIRKAIGRSG